MSDQELEQSPAALTSRRAFLARSVGASGSLFLLGAAGCAEDGGSPAPPLAETGEGTTAGATALPPGKDPANFIVHSDSPLAAETKRASFGTSVIVPYELLFVRNNLPTPDASIAENVDAWAVSVEGVGGPRTITVGELKSLGLETVATVLQCSGNGRGFFEHGPSGGQWTVGAAGCVLWSGVPVRLVAEALGGPAAGARFVTATGGEALPDGVDPLTVVVERSIPLAKGMDDALLAWQMNGEPIPLVHGGPLRLIVPGYYGVNNVKFVKRLAFTPEETQASIQRSSYRVRPIGESGDPSQPTMWEMPVKSWVNHPSGEQTARAGRVMVDGVAFGGIHPVRGVEVSVDGGQTWQEARLVGPDLGRYAWRQFSLPVTLQPGRYTLVSRATDSQGNTQPELRRENERGYGHNGWRDPAVSLTVA